MQVVVLPVAFSCRASTCTNFYPAITMEVLGQPCLTGSVWGLSDSEHALDLWKSFGGLSESIDTETIAKGMPSWNIPSILD